MDTRSAGSHAIGAARTSPLPLSLPVTMARTGFHSVRATGRLALGAQLAVAWWAIHSGMRSICGCISRTGTMSRRHCGSWGASNAREYKATWGGLSTRQLRMKILLSLSAWPKWPIVSQPVQRMTTMRRNWIHRVCRMMIPGGLSQSRQGLSG